MNSDERQFLMTTAWLFMRHGQSSRAVSVCEALVEDDPRDGVSSVALAELLIDGGDASRALELLRAADVPKELDHAEAVLETRALKMLGRGGEATDRWNRHLESRKGSARKWKM
jgi:predicted Zn-dependent protease